MKFRLLTALALIMAMVTPAAAYTVLGSIECPDVVKEDANENYRLANKWWVLGYMTGRNYERDSSTAKDADHDKLYARVLKFCRNNPGKDMDDAALDLYDRLR